MKCCDVDIDIDVFEHKRSILQNYTTEELEKELLKRKDDLDYSYAIKKRDCLEFEYEVDLSNYESEIMDKLDDDDCIKHLENNYYTVFHEDDEYYLVSLNKHTLANMLGLKWWSTKEQILDELEHIL